MTAQKIWMLPKRDVPLLYSNKGDTAGDFLMDFLVLVVKRLKRQGV